MKKQKGFTLIELVMVIVILGILAAVAVPQFGDLTDKAQNAATLGIVGGVKSGISLKYAVNIANGITSADAWPDSLDNAAAGSQCGPTNAFFDLVLAQGGIKETDWSKGTPSTKYIAPNGSTYVYTNTSGEFVIGS